MNRLLILSLTILSVIILNSCTIAKISGTSSKPLILNNPNAKVTVIEHFTESRMITFDYTNSFDVNEIIASLISKYPNANAITNVKITLKSDVGCFFVNLVTLGFARATIFEVSGDFVKIEGSYSKNLFNEERKIDLTKINDNVIFESKQVLAY